MSTNAEQRERIAIQVEQAMSDRGWSQARLAKEAGVSENTVLSILHGKRNTQPGKLRAVLDALGLSPASDVIELDGTPEDVRIFITVAAKRLSAMPEHVRSRALADLYPRLLVTIDGEG